MSLLGIDVLFRCKNCTNDVYFDSLIEFVEHKRKEHFIEFRSIRCIVFEERTEFYPDTAEPGVIPPFTCNSTLEADNTEEEEANSNPEIETKPDLEPVIISSSVSHNIFTPRNRYQTHACFTNEANTTEHPHEIIDSADADINHQLELDPATYSLSQTQRHQPDPSQGFPISESVISEADLDTEILPDLPSPNEQSATSPSPLVTMITNNTSNPETALSSCVFKSVIKSRPTSSKIRIKKPQKTDKTLKNIKSTQLIPNPYIFVRRLTPLEIQNSSSAAPGYETSLMSEYGPKLKRRRRRPVVQSVNFECASCHKIIRSRNRYSYHIKICGRAKKKRSYLPKVCDQCGLQCFDVSSLKIHKLRKHVTEEEKAASYQFACPHCPGRSFIHKSMLDDHTKTNHGLKPNLCHECGMSFLRPSHLARHVLHTHSDESPFKCQEPNCGKTFKIQSYLDVHMASHSELRLFPCTDPNCKKTFKHPTYVTKHLRQVPHGDEAKAKAKAKAKGSASTETTEILTNNLIN